MNKIETRHLKLNHNQINLLKRLKVQSDYNINIMKM